jgi:hypothetical protein
MVPIRVRDHLGLGNVSKKLYQCKPSVEHIESHAQVVKEVKRRDEHEKIQARDVAQRSLESGQADDAIDEEKFGKRTHSSNNGSHVHSRRLGKERRWICNGPELSCLLDFR